MFFDILLRVLLWSISLRLRWRSRRDAAFRALLAGQDFTMLVRTFDGAVQRASRFVDGRVMAVAVPAASAQASFTLSFLDSRYAIRTLLGTRDDPSLMMTGVQEQKVRFEGDFQKFAVFMQLMQYLAQLQEKAN